MAVGSADWNRIFGEGWQAFQTLEPDIGFYLLDHKSRTADVDENLIRILDAGAPLSYEKLTIIVAQLSEYRSKDTTLTLRLIENTSEISAGIIKLRRIEERAESDIILPVYPQAKLVKSMISNSSPSLFALIQLEERDRMTLTGAQIFAALSAIIAAAPLKTMISRQARTRFWVFIPDFSGDEIEFMKKLQQAVINCSTDRDPVSDPDNSYCLTFSAGCGAPSDIPAQRMHTAEYTLFEASRQGVGSICLYSIEKYESQKSEYAGIRKFLSLVDGNLFSYNFQPIVDVRTGDVVAYEALMRTDKSIDMRPLEVISYAEQLKRLYDVERLTMRNTLNAISKNQEALHNRKLFVNSIPAHMLTDSDWNELELQYGELMEKMVIELTEQSEPSPEMLKVVHERLGKNNMKLAIDDYGTGYSNTSNLVKYKPDVVKIDRALIENINLKPKMQRLVGGLIEFMHENGYLALAEGVETHEELKVMIQLGSDLLQGFYVSRPKPVMIYEISSNIRDEIMKINLEYSGSATRSYHPKNGETVDLCELVQDRYTTVFVEVPHVTFVGKRDKSLNLNIIVSDDLTSEIVLKNIYLSGERSDSLITLGDNCHVTLELNGKNELLCRGISVPLSSSLRFTGAGSLHIRAEMTKSYAIGCDCDSSPGRIDIELTGKLWIETSGENAVAIGGGKNEGSNPINITSGSLSINISGNSCAAIGNFRGDSIINISDCVCSIDAAATNAVGIGSINGSTCVNISNYSINTVMRGSNLCGIGVCNNGTGSISMRSGRFASNMHGSNLRCIGTRGGKLDCDIHLSQLNFDCEGNNAVGVGDLDGSGDTVIDQCGVKCRILSGNYIDLGTKNGLLSIDGTETEVTIND